MFKFFNFSIKINKEIIYYTFIKKLKIKNFYYKIKILNMILNNKILSKLLINRWNNLNKHNKVLII